MILSRLGARRPLRQTVWQGAHGALSPYDRNSMRVGIIDIGSNSTRLLAAEVDGVDVTEIERRTTVTRLGRGVDQSGKLAEPAIEAVCDAIRTYLDLFESLQIDQIDAIATSAVRDAVNGDAFLAELRERFALDARAIDGEEEARLTYLGATAGSTTDRTTQVETLVCDIGGGSTELIVGSGNEISFYSSLQAGVVRQSERHVVSDPPTQAELEAVAIDVRGLIDEAVPVSAIGAAQQAIAVAGTPTSLAAIDLGLDPYDPNAVHGHRLQMDAIQRMFSQLAGKTLEQRQRVTGLHPDRAPTIVTGTVILIQVMRAFGIDRIEVSEHDILYGAALSLDRQRAERVGDGG